MAIPHARPDAIPLARAAAIHSARAASSPAGNFVTRTAASEMTPGTLRSSPPCWTTRVCPRAATARTAAKHETVRIELGATLPGASTRLTA